MNEPVSNPFDNRVNEARVAAILASIATPPNRRVQRQIADLDGDFDFWFDGGACRHHTGSAHFHFADGTIAIVACPAAWLWVKIKFQEGESVEILQSKRDP